MFKSLAQSQGMVAGQDSFMGPGTLTSWSQSGLPIEHMPNLPKSLSLKFTQMYYQPGQH